MGYLRLIAINLALLCCVLVIAFVLVPALNLAFASRDSSSEGKIALPNYSQAEWAAQHFKEWEALETEYYSFVAWRRKPFSGETIVIEGPYGERQTPRPAGATEPVVFFFGGSTMWGTGARNQDTIPALYAAATGRIARNFGESGYIIHQSLEMLLWLLRTGERPDIAVFYDGVNDVTLKCEVGHNLFKHGQEDLVRKRVANEPASLRYFAEPLLALLSEGQAPGWDCDDDPAKARAVAQAILDDWESARAVANAHGIRFYAVLQPVLYLSQTRKDHLPAKRREEERQRQFEAVYPLVRQELAARGFADFTQVLDKDQHLYFDFCHVSPNGNALIAEAFRKLVD